MQFSIKTQVKVDKNIEKILKWHRIKNFCILHALSLYALSEKKKNQTSLRFHYWFLHNIVLDC